MILDKLNVVIEKVSDTCCAGMSDKPTGDATTEAVLEVEEETREEAIDALKTPIELSNTKPLPESALESVPESAPLPVEEKPKADASKLPELSMKDFKHETLKWAELPTEAREAAHVLGYTEKLWDGQHYVAESDKKWQDLTAEEFAAADALGWDEVSWATKYEELNFSDIPAHVRRAAEFLGFDEKMWDDGKWPEATDKQWQDLTKDQKTAYATFGYTRHTWD